MSLINTSVSNTGFDASDKAIANQYILKGYIIIFLFLGSIVTWATFAPISSASIATGLVSKDGYTKTIQHLEGGIINKILVKDGDTVQAGQGLIELRDIQSRSDYELLHKQKIIALAREAVLLAELNVDISVPFKLPPGISSEVSDDYVRDAVKGHVEAFHIRKKTYQEKIDIIDQRTQQAKQKVGALVKEKHALNKEGLVIQKEHKKYEELQKKGLVTRSLVFSLWRENASNETDKAANMVSIESTRQEINNLKMEKTELKANHINRIITDLDKVRAQLVDLDVKLTKTDDRLERTIIRAPIDGVVVNLSVNTIGGVVKPGQALLDIVPEAGNLIIEAQVNPNDRDTIKVGQTAEVRFMAFNQRNTEPVQGKVVLISADRLVDVGLNGSPMGYYKVKIELLGDPSEVLNGVSVFPGMQADVMIITGKRTALQYFMKPIVNSFNRAFRDD